MVMTDSVTRSEKSEHSIKLPHLYKEGSKILEAYAQKKGTLKSLVYATGQERVSMKWSQAMPTQHGLLNADFELFQDR